MSRRIHISQSVDGALANWKARDWKMIAKDNGVSVSQAKKYFAVKQAEGVKRLPIGPRCKGFSDETGCPGHEVAT